MALERMQVTNHERWGNLVKTWSTGKNYLDDDNEYPIPTTVDQFKEQLAKAQVFMSISGPLHESEFRRAASGYDRGTLAARPGDRGFRGEAQPAGSDLSASPFYKRLFNGMDPAIPEAEKFKVHAERIGDYTISYCS